MSEINWIILLVQVIVIIWLFRTIHRVAMKDMPKFSSIGATIIYYRERLNSGDKFVITPIEPKSVPNEKKQFLQFKVHKTINGKVIDLVYPIVENEAQTKPSQDEIISLLSFFKLTYEKYYDATNKISFYLIEIDPLNIEHISVLFLIGTKYQGMKLSDRFKIELIKKDVRESSERYNLDINMKLR